MAVGLERKKKRAGEKRKDKKELQNKSIQHGQQCAQKTYRNSPSKLNLTALARCVHEKQGVFKHNRRAEKYFRDNSSD